MSKLFIATLFIFMMNKSHAVTITINDQNQQPLANAVVWLTATDNTLQALPTDSPFTMTQKQRQFTPHILVVPQNAQVEFPNADSIMHHVYSFSSAKSFELKLYREQPQAPIRFDQTGVVELGCNIHDWMLGYIVVVDSPFYGVTNNQGQIELTPQQGNFKLNVWHEGFSDISQTESKTIALTSAAIVYQIEQSIVPRITIGVDDYE